MKQIVLCLCIYILCVKGTLIKLKDATTLQIALDKARAVDVVKLLPIIGELRVTKSLTIPDISNTGVVQSMSGSGTEIDVVSIKDTKEGIIVANDEKNALKSLTVSNADADLQVRTNYVTLLHSSITSGNVSMQMDKDICYNIFKNNILNRYVNFLGTGYKLSTNVDNGGNIVTGFHNGFKTMLCINYVPTAGDTYGAKIIYYNGPTINNYISVDLDKAESIVNDPKFNTNRTTVLFIHGYNQSPATLPSQTLISSYISNGDYNFIMLDWHTVASGNVAAVMRRVNPLGLEVARFFCRLNEKGVSLSKMHLVGHSFGAHISAIAGKYTIQWSDKTKQIDRISGLDPANFYDYSVMYKYARFVDIIHTAAGGFGNPANMGHVDFWPNDGVARQPGCPIPTFPITLEQLACSHLRAIYFWSESVQRKNHVNFLSVNQANPEMRIQMGNNCPTSNLVQGYYTLTTNSASFYSKN